MKTYLITGGAGFIGANFVKYMLKKYEKINLVILDKLTYAGNVENIREELEDSRVSFVKGDICNRDLVEKIFQRQNFDYVVNFAAESHVDRSIKNPGIFLRTNIIGTQVLLDVSKAQWIMGTDEKGYPVYKEGKKFLQVSTDEVYGDLVLDYPDGKELEVQSEELKEILKKRNVKPKTFGESFFTEDTPLNPRSPYATSKAAADMLVRAYSETYHMPINITRCSNNYGPYQFPEKLIPLIIKNILDGKKLPVYGDGRQVRDWLYVEDHCKGIDMVINKGRLGEVYNIGGFNEEQNITIVKLIIDELSQIVRDEPRYLGALKIDLEAINYGLITFVKDRLGHDVRYAIDPTKTIRELRFYSEISFTDRIEKTIRWYLENQEWVEYVVSGDYQKYYSEMYGNI
ncbi:dTDP-glucose 4,6-dehydratase [uncultured Ilyobacter sp.]|uniref:dTDP-glucose 4,6-dehydratase n=1 Tax=uncultured Ilyobacter sp. TaxID=544433 RepID=UPI0029C76519|nr:dTDP-glucose 4,6-dehydratase [uncultured Ilyobacter sp.]